MTAKEFIAKDLRSRFGVDVEVHNQYYTGEQWIEQMELYHEAKLKLLGIANVVGRSEQYHCELYDFGRKNKPCDKQCDGCKAMNLD